jgi:phosphate transport system protein
MEPKIMAVMTEHTMKAFDADLQELSRMIAEMGGLAERQIADAVDALNRRDAILAQSVIPEDAKIDLLQREIEEKAILTIARRQPMAVDLRDVVGALRVSNDPDRRPSEEHRQARHGARQRSEPGAGDARRRPHD